MTNAAKWKEFLRWWEEYRQGMSRPHETNIFAEGIGSVVDRVDDKIEELQKGLNAK